MLAALVPPPGDLLVALHNNGKGYSVQNEVPLSNEVSLADPGHPHDIFLAKHPEDYHRLAAGPYNAVLQQNAAGPDDGSLSRLMAARSGRYVNLEVELGKAARQREMLQWLERMLP